MDIALTEPRRSSPAAASITRSRVCSPNRRLALSGAGAAAALGKVRGRFRVMARILVYSVWNVHYRSLANGCIREAAMGTTHAMDQDERGDDAARGLSRRRLLGAAAGLAALPWVGAAAAPGAGPPNILFLLVDQKRFFRPGELPQGYELPGHARLTRRGTTFVNHRISSCVCTSSRSVIYTGQHIQHTKMFDNTNFPWISSMSTELPTLGSMLREAGYYTAYKGKWHLTKEFETVNKLGSPTKIFTQEMEAYGFSDYFGIGDIIAHTQGGYLHDGVIAAMATSWLRGKGRELAAENKP